jgi:hypothetical protein
MPFKDLKEWWESPEQAVDENMLLNIEQVSICALAAYTAHEYGVSQDLVMAITMAQFGATDISQIRRKDYGTVSRYLVDLNPKEQIN